MRVCPSALLFTSLTPCSVCNLATTQPAVATCRERAIVCRHSPYPANAPLFTSFHFYWTSEQLIQARLLCAQCFLFSCSLMDQYEWAERSQIIRLKTMSLITSNNIWTNLVIFLSCLWDLLMDMNFELNWSILTNQHPFYLSLSSPASFHLSFFFFPSFFQSVLISYF